MTARKQSGKHMPRSICVDLNIIIDIVQQRDGWEGSSDCLEHAENVGIELCLPAHVVTTFGYLLQRFGVRKAHMYSQLNWLMGRFTVLPVSKKQLEQAIGAQWNDFEDAVVAQSAVAADCDYIVTRNTKDFQASTIPVVSPEELLQIT